MLNLNFEPFPVLSTQRLILREVTLEDAEQIFIQRSHPVINKYIHRKLALSIVDAVEFIQKITDNQKKKQSINWAITEKDNNILIGTICLWNIDALHDIAEVGYSLHPDFYKKGIMNEALNAVITFGFNRMNTKRIDAFTSKENSASLNLLARNGFKRNKALEHSLDDPSELAYNQIFSLVNNLTSC